MRRKGKEVLKLMRSLSSILFENFQTMNIHKETITVRRVNLALVPIEIVCIMNVLREGT